MGGKSRGRGKGKGDLEEKPPKDNEEDEDERLPVERRVDPSSGLAHTFTELAASYKGQKTRKEVQEYWDTECTPAPEVSRKYKPKSQNASSSAPAEEAPPLRKSGKGDAGKDSGKAGKAGKGGAKGGESRVDPEDGTVLTFEELSSWYRGYSQKALQEFWDACLPMKSKTGKGGSGKDGQARGKGKKPQPEASWWEQSAASYWQPEEWSSSSWAEPEEKRLDPNDGCAYTFEELALFYKGKYNRKVTEAYWNNECQPLRSSGKAGKGGKASQKQASAANAGKGSGRRAEADGKAAPKARPSRKAPEPEEPEHEEEKANKPRLHVANFANTQEIAVAMKDGGWNSDDVGNAKDHGSILVPGGRHLNPLSDAGSTPLPMGLRVRAEELGELLKDLVLMGGEGDFPGLAFALLPGGGEVRDALLDGLGVRKAARREAIMEPTTWDLDFTDQQMGANIGKGLREATELLKNFGTTYELNFSESVGCAPVLYFAQSSCSDDKPILGVIHTREWH